MIRCPYCGSNKGYYTTELIRRNKYYTFNGIRTGTKAKTYKEDWKLCIECGRVLPKKNK